MTDAAKAVQEVKVLNNQKESRISVKGQIELLDTVLIRPTLVSGYNIFSMFCSM